MRLLIRLMMAAALCAGAAGCVRSDQAQQTTVRFWAMGKEAEVVTELVADFEKRNPSIRVEVQNIPMTAAHEKLLTAFAADGLPDVCQLGNTWLPEFALLDTLAPLQPYVARSTVVTPADYFPGVWDTNVVDGTLYGVPWYVDTRLLFYRKDLLRQAGYSQMPKTWAEMQQVMAAIKRHVGPDRYAILMPLNEFEQQLSFALQQDDRLLRDHDNYGNFRSAGFRKALAFYDGMYQNGWAPKVSETQVSNVWYEFFNGYYAFYLSGPWNVREFKLRQPPGMEGTWGTAPLPGPDGPGAGIAGGSSLVIFKSSQHKDASWKLIEYLSQPQVQARFHAIIGDLPPRRSTWKLPSLANDELARAFGDQLERVKATPKVLEWERIVQEMRLVTERVVRGGQSHEAAVQELDQRVDDILAKRRWIFEQEGGHVGPAAVPATPPASAPAPEGAR
ncbi:sugar ABC transporter substrate-binding protein [Xanthomonas sp. NCPPB 1638]|uniref:ABC transporter substrate-binding protein n=1 Tax=Xanthomonas cucurbitae TaxID=56453 RepID=A0A2S7DMY8_9XANT|nr:sugar ABC transporter substrate-binding protein [Xanthomonas cucurbitae]PPU75208.1 ABC transporter substrate-binding protein [Xanthomonas cucurbitae]WDM80780.1 sugar ABC transporter substrate-binding protein [Xanthomonas cucurbitae]WDM84476.1 sugar ABC transporter substrate-binding protein [Xanthomonas cucurbitae]